MKRILLVLSLSFCLFSTFAQRSSYTGNYMIDDKFKGEATYEYIEVNGKRVFDGLFVFRYSNSFRVMSGTFNRGLKNGSWSFEDNNSPNVYCNFKNGKLDGLYRRESSYNNMKVNFKDNVFVGSFEAVYEKKEYTGQFNNEGRADGEWLISGRYPRSGAEYVRTLIWDNGTLVSDEEYDKSTGVRKNHLHSKHFKLAPSYDNVLNSLPEYVRSHPIYDLYKEKSAQKDKGRYIGESPLRQSPFDGTSRIILTPQEIIKKEEYNLRKQKEEDAKTEKERLEKERMQQEEMEIEKKIQEDMIAFDSSIYGTILSEMKSSLHDLRQEKGLLTSNNIIKSDFDNIKRKHIRSTFKVTPMVRSDVYNKKFKTISFPIKFGIKDNNEWIDVGHLVIYDNTGKGWMNNIVDGTVVCNKGNSVSIYDTGVFFESQNFILGVNSSKQLYITQKKNGKLKKTEIINPANSNSTPRAKGLFYKIEDRGRAADSIIDPWNDITEKELEKSTRSRIEAKYPISKPKK